MQRNVSLTRFLRITWIMMEPWIWIFFISSLFSMLAKHACQVPPNYSTKSLNPIILLPASSEISYESLHYPVPVEQQYQVIPLVINTGKIPLINQAIQAPIQYFVPKSENQHTPIYESAQYLPTRDERVQLRNPETILNSNDQEIKNRLTYDRNNYSPTATAKFYSTTHVDGRPASRGYSYGYKIINGHVDGLNDQHNVPRITDDGRSASYHLSKSEETDKVFEHKIEPNSKLQDANNKRKTDKFESQNNGPDNTTRTFKPIVVKTELNATETELKKYYKKVKNSETPINKVTNKNGN
ncbi:uncharacterized protein LOC112597707 [Melanaphis sacchari]|uniref:uncharacterized protein LOC112597707 n=1 Tax=Melanaphis sacchari TaxID=742174 RepID=UPI000DC12F1B|nr:uncharacterized protein LOC112597707 [Melanaphis sacchari]